MQTSWIWLTSHDAQDADTCLGHLGMKGLSRQNYWTRIVWVSNSQTSSSRLWFRLRQSNFGFKLRIFAFKTLISISSACFEFNFWQSPVKASTLLQLSMCQWFTKFHIVKSIGKNKIKPLRRWYQTYTLWINCLQFNSQAGSYWLTLFFCDFSDSTAHV